LSQSAAAGVANVIALTASAARATFFHMFFSPFGPNADERQLEQRVCHFELFDSSVEKPCVWNRSSRERRALIRTLACEARTRAFQSGTAKDVQA
jgi:hypothetical protein